MFKLNFSEGKIWGKKSGKKIEGKIRKLHCLCVYHPTVKSCTRVISIFTPSCKAQIDLKIRVTVFHRDPYFFRNLLKSM